MRNRFLIPIGIILALGALILLAVTLTRPPAAESQGRLRTATPSHPAAPGGPTARPVKGNTPAPLRDMVPQLPRDQKTECNIRHPNGDRETYLVPRWLGDNEIRRQFLGPGDTLMSCSYRSEPPPQGSPPPPGVEPPGPFPTPSWFPPPPVH
jgi:hypothetical protein